ncbi:hypothetical protein GALMADRAFT_136295 [Galerina marginata CBS 339.88]|uniref:Uncharacterized protein n=1 Tax=Galerina marginata (strain CBS 339.88) TaxID=685588 RepID=A0A067TMX4_GALM3|nr:hypothetical protein GALMADRAFT_136295 [Galerina marginata CBS 339.88]
MHELTKTFFSLFGYKWGFTRHMTFQTATSNRSAPARLHQQPINNVDLASQHQPPTPPCPPSLTTLSRRSRPQELFCVQRIQQPRNRVACPSHQACGPALWISSCRLGRSCGRRRAGEALRRAGRRPPPSDSNAANASLAKTPPHPSFTPPHSPLHVQGTDAVEVTHAAVSALLPTPITNPTAFVAPPNRDKPPTFPSYHPLPLFKVQWSERRILAPGNFARSLTTLCPMPPA